MERFATLSSAESGQQQQLIARLELPIQTAGQLYDAAVEDECHELTHASTVCVIDEPLECLGRRSVLLEPGANRCIWDEWNRGKYAPFTLAWSGVIKPQLLAEPAVILDGDGVAHRFSGGHAFTLGPNLLDNGNELL
jgi:hypothetical protein